ncbi:MAG TPA: hypothetical protein VFB96_06040 [Pirellulaceae bacterium]|nr:hypothetical protein [Pirellulaceae bacterium]
MATLFVVTTILCLHFALAATNPGLAIWAATISLAIATIYVTRSQFRLSSIEAGATAIFGTPIFVSVVFAALLTIDYLTSPQDPSDFVQSPDAIVFLTVSGGFFGFLVGFFVAVAYWTILGIRVLVRSGSFDFRKKYYIEE